MYSTGKLVTSGVSLFICLAMLPLWYVLAGGKATSLPELEVVSTEKQCIEETRYMRAKHMDLLYDWRDTVARQGTRTFVATDGRKYTMSLTGTCLDCHSNKSAFCDRCHNYAGVAPGCWDCHVAPQE